MEEEGPCGATLSEELAYLRRRVAELERAVAQLPGAQQDRHDAPPQAGSAVQLPAGDARYGELADSLTDVFFAMDATLHYTYWNKASETLTGISAEEAIGKSLHQLFPDTKDSEIEALYLEVLSTREPRSLETTYRLAGQPYSFEISAYPSKGGIAVFARDITERVRAEQAMKESEEKFRTLAEQSPNMIFINRGGSVVYANRQCEETMGYTREEFYAPDFDWLSLIVPQDRQRLRESFARHGRGEDVNPYEYALITKSGRRIEAIITTKLIDYEKEKAILGTVTDITERKRAEEEIHRHNTELAALQEISLDLAAHREPSDLLQAIVSRAVDLLDAVGGGLYLYRPATDDLEYVFTHKVASNSLGTVLKRGEGLSGKVLETGQALYVDDYGRWDGRSRQFEGLALTACAAVPIQWGGRILGVLNVDREAPQTFSPDDIATLERFVLLAGTALEQTRLLEEARARWHEAETLRQAGAAVTEVLTLDERLGRILEQLERVVPYDSASIQLLWEDSLEIVGGRGFADPEKVLGLRFPVPGDNPNTAVIEQQQPAVLPDARTAHPPFRDPPHDHIRSWMGVPLIVRDRVIGLLAVDSAEVGHFNQDHVRLVTPFAAQVAVALENARLYSDLQRQMASLKSAQAQLVQSARLAAVGELAAGVAHELNNPLTSVLGYAEMLLETADLDATPRRDLETIASEARRARNIVRGLLDFARQTRPRQRPTDIHETLRHTLAVIRLHLEQSGIQIEEDYAPGIGLLSIDEGQMKQVFLNLITNAMRAMPKGGTLRLRTCRAGDRVGIAISDTGVGIPSENMERIFDPFFTTCPEGTGLGLSVSLGIVQEHRGHLSVESTEGQGSTFTVWLPVEPTAA